MYVCHVWNNDIHKHCTVVAAILFRWTYVYTCMYVPVTPPVVPGDGILVGVVLGILGVVGVVGGEVGCEPRVSVSLSSPLSGIPPNVK